MNRKHIKNFQVVNYQKADERVLGGDYIRVRPWCKMM